MTKIVYNACYGGFGLSHEAIMRYAEIKGITLYHTEESGFFNHYYLCPPEEYERLRAEDETNPFGPERYVRSNAMYFSLRNIERSDPALVQVVEELGNKASDRYAELTIEDIPAGTLYRIDEYDGFESVMTQDTYDWKVA
jgi:hypothetical protein